MSWYPAAKRMELQPESGSQPAIRPTQLIMHSIAAPWTKERIFEYWRDSTNLESHFGQSFDGTIAQFIGTQTRADANASANRRSDGTGAVSIETASNLQHTDPWTDGQIAGLIDLGVWMHREHDIPLRVCRTWTDPGFGYHRLFPEWSVGGTACPGDARVRQFKDIVFPGIVSRAQGVEEDVALTDADVKRIAAEVWQQVVQGPDGREVTAGSVLGWSDTVEVITRREIADKLTPMDKKIDIIIQQLIKVQDRVDQLEA